MKYLSVSLWCYGNYLIAKNMIFIFLYTIRDPVMLYTYINIRLFFIQIAIMVRGYMQYACNIKHYTTNQISSILYISN